MVSKIVFIVFFIMSSHPFYAWASDVVEPPTCPAIKFMNTCVDDTNRCCDNASSVTPTFIGYGVFTTYNAGANPLTATPYFCCTTKFKYINGCIVYKPRVTTTCSKQFTCGEGNYAMASEPFNSDCALACGR